MDKKGYRTFMMIIFGLEVVSNIVTATTNISSLDKAAK